MKERKHKKIKIAIITIITVILLWVIYDFTPLIKVPLANKIYGTSKCTLYNRDNTKSELTILLNDKEHPIIGGCAFTKWNCKLCYRGGESSTTIIPKLCDRCAKITNRCAQCAKLKEKE